MEENAESATNSLAEGDVVVPRKPKINIPSPREAVPKRASPERASPERASPERASPSSVSEGASQRLPERASPSSVSEGASQRLPERASPLISFAAGSSENNSTSYVSYSSLRDKVKSQSLREKVKSQSLRGKDVRVTGSSLRHVETKVSRIDDDEEYYYPSQDRVRIPKGSKLVKTSEGDFVVKKYEEMTDEEAQRERAFWEMRFRSLNQAWEKEKTEFRVPTDDETLENIDIRYQMSVRYVASLGGSDIYRIALMGIWMVIEAGLVYIGVPASGYFECQLMMYDIYERKIVEMGQTVGGFGKGWSPMTCLFVYSVVSAAIVIGANKLLGEGSHSSDAARAMMRKVATLISGGNHNVVIDENGIPVPASRKDPVAGVADGLGFGGLGDILGGGNMSGMLGGMFSAFTSSMGGEPKKRKGPTHKS